MRGTHNRGSIPESGAITSGRRMPSSLEALRRADSESASSNTLSM